MKHAFTVLRYTLLRNVRDIPSSAEMVLTPLVLIFLLGTVLGDAFDSRDIGATPVTYVVETDGPYAEALHDFLNREEVGRYLTVTESPTRAEAHRLLEAKEVVTAIIVGAVDDGDAQDGGATGPAITLLERPGSSLRTGVVRSVLGTFTRGANVSYALAREGRTGVVYEPIPAGFEERTLSRAGRAPGAFDFYAVSMLVLFVMYIAQYAVDGLREDLMEPIGDRVRSTPIAGWAHISGKLAAHVVTGVIQAAVIVIVTSIVFRANWGTQPLLLVAIVLSICIFAAALGGLVLAITWDGRRAQGIISIVVLVSMILSGGAFQFTTTSPSFQAFQRLLPHYQGQRAILAMVYGGDAGGIGAAFIYFFGGAAILFLITTILARRTA